MNGFGIIVCAPSGTPYMYTIAVIILITIPSGQIMSEQHWLNVRVMCVGFDAMLWLFCVFPYQSSNDATPTEHPCHVRMGSQH